MVALRLRKRAYTLGAIVEAGVPASIARTLLADGPRAVPERALLSVGGRRRTKEPTTLYVWGSDAMILLAEWEERCRSKERTEKAERPEIRRSIEPGKK